MVIQGDGNVGIGTANPSHGRMQLACSSQSPDGGLTIRGGDFNAGLGAMWVEGSGSGQKFNIQAYKNESTDPPAGVNPSTLDADAYSLCLNPKGGNVGIGTASPGYKLDVYGDANGIDLGPIAAMGFLDLGVSFCGIKVGQKVSVPYSRTALSVEDSGVSILHANGQNKCVGIGTASPTSTLHLTNQGGTFNLGGSLRNQYNSLGVTAASITAGYNTGSGPTDNGDGSYTWTKGGGDINGAIAIGFIGAPHEQLKITFTAKTTDTTSPSLQYENPAFTSLYSDTLNTTYTTYTFYVTLPATPYNGLNYFRVYADDITWNALTVERADVFTGGNVGIGTASPRASLDIEGTTFKYYNVYNYQDAWTSNNNQSFTIPVTGGNGFSVMLVEAKVIQVAGNSSSKRVARVKGMISNYDTGNFYMTVIEGENISAFETYIVGTSLSATGTFTLKYRPEEGYLQDVLCRLELKIWIGGYTSSLGDLTRTDLGSNSALTAPTFDSATKTFGGNVGIGYTNPSCQLDFGIPIQNKIISLYGGTTSTTAFYGFGINSGTLRYNVIDTNDVHKFYGGSTEYGYINDATGFVNSFTG